MWNAFDRKMNDESVTRTRINDHAASTVRTRRNRHRNRRAGIAARSTCASGSWLAGFSEFSCESKTGDLSAPVRCALANGPVRLQARSHKTFRRRTTGFYPHGSAAHSHDFETKEISRATINL